MMKRPSPPPSRPLEASRPLDASRPKAEESRPTKEISAAWAKRVRISVLWGAAKKRQDIVVRRAALGEESFCIYCACEIAPYSVVLSAISSLHPGAMICLPCLRESIGAVRCALIEALL